MTDTIASPTGRRRWVVILPAAFLMYTISFFDRVNIGMALPHIMKGLSLTPSDGGWVGSAFSWGYVITQLAAGYLALRFGPRRLIAVSLFVFGAAAIATGLVHTFGELVAIRVVLGLAEGPIYAATSMFLAQWFIKSERGRAFGIWNLAVPAGAFFAGPVSGLILSHYDWRVMMIVEGLPAWIFCIVWLARIPKSFRDAPWLTPTDAEIISEELANEQAGLEDPCNLPWWSILSLPIVWFLTIGFALNGVLLYGATLWLPTIMKSYGQLSELTIGILSGMPFVAAMFGIFFISYHSDKHQQERRLHAAIPTAITGVFMIAAAIVPSNMYYLQVIFFVISGFTLKMLNPMVFSWITEVLPTRKAVPAIAVVSGVGNFIGQFAGPLVVGYTKSVANGYFLPLMVLGICAILGAFALLMAHTGSAPKALSEAV